MPKYLLKSLVVFFGIAAGLLLAEGASRLFLAPAFHSDFLLHFPTTTPQYELDADVGYRPRFFEDLFYTKEGITLRTSYIVDKAEKQILFIGDSVVRRGRIQKALQEAHPGMPWSYLNGGVEGYNVVQEVGYFFKYLKVLHLKRIVLVFHNNDLLYFPMIYLLSRHSAFWYFPGEPAFPINLDLFKLSHLYRHWCALNYGILMDRSIKKHSLVADSKAALARLKEYTEANKIPLQVFVFPLMKRFDGWTEEEKASHRSALKMLQELGIEHFDLYEAIREVAVKNVRLTEDSAEDFWHPNEEAARLMASYLKRRGVFERW